MSKKFFLEKKINDEYLVKYFLLEDNYYDHKNNRSLFGVELELFSADSNLKTREIIEKITDSKDIILHMLDIMVEKDVTPGSLLYTVDEIFDIVTKNNRRS